MNEYDSLLASKILEKDATATQTVGDADVILLNTCAVRENAHQKIYNRLRELGHLHKRGAKIGILGCMAQNLREDLLYENLPVDFIMGPDALRNLTGLIDGTTPQDTQRSFLNLSRTETYDDIVPSFEHHMRGRDTKITAFVTIQRGCNNFCAFCVVPYTRGRERSRPAESVVNEVRSLVDSGVKSVVLLGQNVNSYHFEETRFVDLIEELLAKTTIERIYFTSPHPKDFPIELIKLMAHEPRFCNQVHMPLQAGADATLKRMKRNYTRSEFLTIVENFRSRVADVAISTDVIVGFPGESESDFEETLDVMAEADFDSAFMFAYSERKGTIAQRLYPDDVPDDVKKRRLATLIEKQLARSLINNERYIGRTVAVMAEQPSRRNTAEWVARLANGRKVIFHPHGMALATLAGNTVRITITGASSQVLHGTLSTD
ncbi:MAG: tRNA (N6-isopentenyl adenosine(37)-C2)-methylthiotransferase MiaB [Spirochaetes bacterium]|nr:tRNA (N6-isopentenyl adenosine(37)-C2)-methylthiotransferase MiaB [Spirochaetota bacterium]